MICKEEEKGDLFIIIIPIKQDHPVVSNYNKFQVFDLLLESTSIASHLLSYICSLAFCRFKSSTDILFYNKGKS
jgi:hypothetical protein